MSHSCQQREKQIEVALGKAAKVCKKHGARLTDVRKNVLELIWSSEQPSKAYDLLKELQKNDPSAKPPTIYRALDFLLELGLIHKLHRFNAYVKCKHPEEKKPCFFLICTNCHVVTESHEGAYGKLINKASMSFDFKPQEATFEIEGLCQQCT